MTLVKLVHRHLFWRNVRRTLANPVTTALVGAAAVAVVKSAGYAVSNVITAAGDAVMNVIIVSRRNASDVPLPFRS